MDDVLRVPIGEGQKDEVPLQVPSAVDQEDALVIPKAVNGINWGDYGEDHTFSKEEILGDRRLMSGIRRVLDTRFGAGKRNKFTFDYEYDNEMSDEEAFEMWQNYQRSFAGGQTVTTANELYFLKDATDYEKRVLADSYRLFDKMPSIWSEDTSWGEMFDGMRDYGWAAIWDPTTVAAAGIGRLYTQVGTKAAAQAAKTMVSRGVSTFTAKSALKGVAKGTTKIITQEAAERAARKGIIKKGVEATGKLMAGTSKRALISGAIFDGSMAVGTDAAYQSALIETDVQEEHSMFQSGVAALGALVVPGLAAGSKAINRIYKSKGGQYTTILKDSRGRRLSKDALTDAMVEEITKVDNDPAKLARVGSNMTETLKHFVDNSEDYARSFRAELDETAKAFTGSKVGATESDLFRVMFLGNDQAGLKGFAQIFHDMGFRYVERVDGDNYTNFMGDLLERVDDYAPGTRKELNNILEKAFDDVDGIEGMSNYYNRLKEVKPDADYLDAFVDRFKQRGSAIASDLWALKEGKRRLGLLGKDERFVSKWFDETVGASVKATDMTGPEYAQFYQNVWKRAITAHYGTTGANLKGFAVTHAMSIATDTVDGVMEFGLGGLHHLVGNTQAGRLHNQRAWGSLTGAMRKGRNLFDWMDTIAGFEVYDKIAGGKVGDDLARWRYGGIESAEAAKKHFNIPTTGAGSAVAGAADDTVGLAQTLTFVQLQDELTKKLAFMGEMDRQIRMTYGQTMSEFFERKDYEVQMMTGKYQLAQERAMELAMRETYNKTYSRGGGRSWSRMAAREVESWSNKPGVGIAIPFGQFFNNTVAMLGDHSGVNAIRYAVKRATGRYIDPVEEQGQRLLAKTVVGWTAVASMVPEAREKIREGLTWDEQRRDDGSLRDTRWEYPESIMRILAQRWAHILEDGEVPPDLAKQAAELMIGQTFRQLDDATQSAFITLEKTLAGEMGAAGEYLLETLGTVGSRTISGVTRPLDVVNESVHFLRSVGDDEYSPTVVDRRQGMQFWNNSTRYIDAFIPSNLPKRQSPTDRGENYRNVGKVMMGVRNAPGKESFDLILGSIGTEPWRMIRWDGPPEVKNRMDEIMGPLLNMRADRVLLKEQGFFDLPLRQRERIAKDIIETSKKEAKDILELGLGSDPYLKIAMEIEGKYSDRDIRWAKDLVGFEGDILDRMEDPDGLMQLDILLDVLENPEAYE